MLNLACSRSGYSRRVAEWIAFWRSSRLLQQAKKVLIEKKDLLLVLTVTLYDAAYQGCFHASDPCERSLQPVGIEGLNGIFADA
jgi:hypothetical protein